MKVLFVRSGNKGAHPITTNQGESLRSVGEDVSYFDVVGKGLAGYLSNVFKFRKAVRILQPDLIHAHYSFTGFLSSLSFTGKPIITSLMGSDLFAFGRIHLMITRFFSSYIWSGTIVKSKWMYKKLNSSKAVVIPNGVDLVLFSQKSKSEAMNHLGWDFNAKHSLFASDPERPEKNFNLTAQAIKKLKEDDDDLMLEIHYLKDIPQKAIPYYYCAADVLLLASNYEGSPNVVKEAMACNCPVVSTDVGDVKWLFGDAPGHYLTGFDPVNVAENIKLAIEFRGKNEQTEGRIRIIELGLDSETIANRIIAIYNNLIERRDSK